MYCYTARAREIRVCAAGSCRQFRVVRAILCRGEDNTTEKIPDSDRLTRLVVCAMVPYYQLNLVFSDSNYIQSITPRVQRVPK